MLSPTCDVLYIGYTNGEVSRWKYGGFAAEATVSVA
jgi:hypothetical protein